MKEGELNNIHFNESLVNQEIIGQSSAAGEIQENTLCKEMERLISILEENIESIKEEVEEMGGIFVINETWNSLDNVQKSELVKELNKLHASYQKGINIQEIGEELLDPRHKAFQEWKRNGNFLGRIVGPIGYVTGIYPATGAILEIIGAASVMLTKIKLKRKIERYKEEGQSMNNQTDQ